MVASQENKHFLKVMELVRKRPGMFIFPVSPVALRNFISGYQASTLFDEDSIGSVESIIDCVYETISDKLNIRRSPDMGWAEMLSTLGEEKGFEFFFDCLYLCLERD